MDTSYLERIENTHGRMAHCFVCKVDLSHWFFVWMSFLPVCTRSFCIQVAAEPKFPLIPLIPFMAWYWALAADEGVGRGCEYLTYLFIKCLIKLIIFGACEGSSQDMIRDMALKDIHRKSIELEIQTLWDLVTFQSRFFKVNSDQHHETVRRRHNKLKF